MQLLSDRTYLLVILLLINSVAHTQAINNHHQSNKSKEAIMTRTKEQAGKAIFIDKFFVPAEAKQEFYERARINRAFIKKLPGFLEDAAYEYTDTNNNLICVTVAQWESTEALNKAREAVQTEYKKQGFDPAAMFARLHITADRGVYTMMNND